MSVILKPVDLTDQRKYDLVNHYYQNFHSTPKELISDKLPEATYLLVCLDTDSRTAPLLGITSYKQITPTLYMTERTIIEPQFRGKGYGKAASNAVEQYLKDLGAHKICCEVLTFNTKMVNIKLSQGYVIEGTMYNHDAPGIHQYFFGKELK